MPYNIQYIGTAILNEIDNYKPLAPSLYAQTLEKIYRHFSMGILVKKNAFSIFNILIRF